MKAGKVKGLDPAAPLRANAARIIRVRLEEMLAFGEAASEPEAAVSQHEMRIAAKRLRYVLEITEGCFGREASGARIGARDLQSVLGNIHDCDVMAPRVREQIGKLPGGEARGGLDLLAAHLETQRALLHGQFLELWRGQRDAGVWSGLERAMRK